MVEFIFIYMNNQYKVETNETNGEIKNIVLKYSSIINKNIKELYFLYKGKPLNMKEKLGLFNNKNYKIFVYNIAIQKNNNKVLENILCLKCKNVARMSIDNNAITIEKCINDHYFKELSLEEFFESQYIKDSEINCSLCKNNKIYYNNLMYINYNSKYICPLCSKNSQINKLTYNYQFYFCIKHLLRYISYCHYCNINLCEKCEEKHKDNKKHKIISYKEIKKKINKNLIENMRNEIQKLQKFKEELYNILNFFNEIINNMNNDIDKYIILYNYFINSIISLNNYENINNSLNFDLKILINNIDSVLNEVNEINKIINLMKIYEMKINKISLLYNFNEKKTINLFGSKFVENNKNKCYLKIDKMNYYIFERYCNIQNEKKKEITLISKIIKPLFLWSNYGITDMSYMFYGCSDFSVLDSSNLDTSHVINMSHMFEGIDLKEIKFDVSKLNTSRVIDMSYMFCSTYEIPDISNFDTSNLKNMEGIFMKARFDYPLPDLSKWNISNVTNISYIFREWPYPIFLSGISKWNTKNVKYMKGIFMNSNYLISIPDISKWNTSNVMDISYMFCCCCDLKSLSKISKWNISNVTNISNIFCECYSLSSLPDISKWNTSNVTDISYMFCGCVYISSLPDISKWNTSNIKNMCGLFKDCESLQSLPDISKWNISNVIDISYMFYRCRKLTNLPDISKWNTNNILDMNSLFEKCNSLKIFPNIAIWKTQKIKEIHNLFNGCLSSAILPNLIKWNIINDPITIQFATTTGIKFNFVLSPNLKFKEVVNMLFKKFNISFEKLKKEAIFIFKGREINIDSSETLNELDLKNNSKIVIFASSDFLQSLEKIIYHINLLNSHI